MAILKSGKYRYDIITKFANIIFKDNYNEYKKKVSEYFSEVKNNFPFLAIVHLPTSSATYSFLYGYLLSADSIDSMGLKRTDDLTEHALCIIALLHEKYQECGIEVIDICNRIDIDSIPSKYKHFRNSDVINNVTIICSHNPKEITKINCVVGVLKSTENYFIELKKFGRIGEFSLICHNH